MGASCWQDLSRLFMEGLVSCYHWDVAACGNSGENRPLMPPPLGSPTLFLCAPFDGSSVKCSSATGGPTYRHPRGGGGGRRRRRANTHGAAAPAQISQRTRPAQTSLFVFLGNLWELLNCWHLTRGYQIFMSNKIHFLRKKVG